MRRRRLRYQPGCCMQEPERLSGVSSGSTPARRSASCTGGRCTISGVLPRGVRSSQLRDFDAQAHVGGHAWRAHCAAARAASSSQNPGAGTTRMRAESQRLLHHLDAQHVFDVVRDGLEPRQANARRTGDHFLLAAEDAAEAAHAQRQLLELAHAPGAPAGGSGRRCDNAPAASGCSRTWCRRPRRVGRAAPAGSSLES